MKSAQERAIYTVRYCLNQLVSLSNSLLDGSLEQESYSRWAAREILLRLEKNRDTPPLIVIEDFRNQVDHFSGMNSHTSYIFSCAKDMAEWILDLLLA